MPNLVKFTDMATGKVVGYIDTTPDPLYRSDAWTTADGRELALGDMEHTHIERVISFLRLRARPLHRRAIDRMIADLSGPLGPRGDMATLAADQEFDDLLRADPREWLESVPIIRALKAELVLRYEPWIVDHVNQPRTYAYSIDPPVWRAEMRTPL